MKENYKNDWTNISLVDLNYLKTGVDEYDGRKDYYSTGSIQDDSVIPEGSYSYTDRPSRANRVCQIGDVIQARMKNTDKAVLINDNLNDQLFSTGFFQIRTDSITILPKYVFYYFKSIVFLNQKDLNCSGSTQSALNDKSAKNLTVPIAPIPIQKKIVTKIEKLFSKLNKGIADLTKAQDQLKVYRQAVLKKAFEGGLTKKWREKQTDLTTVDELLEQIKEERQKHYEEQIEEWKQAVKTWEEKGKEGKKPAKPQKHKDVDALSQNELDELAPLPINWKWIKNNELMFYVTSGSREWKKFYSDTKGTYFVRTGDIKTNKLELDGAAFVDLPNNVEGKRSLIEKGDLLMTITGANVGKIAHVDFEISEAYVSQSVALLKYVLKSFSPYLHYYFQSSATGAKFIGAMVYGVGRPVLSLDNMRDAPVAVCSFEEQHQIVQEIESRLSVCDRLEQSITESLEKAKALRQSILKKAFEGTLLSEKEIAICKVAPDYEPASVLLEKIKAEKKK